MKIDSTHVTFVVQGVIHHVPRDMHGFSTKECLSSIREHFPRSRIILSTYEGSKVDGLDYDELVLCVDPKAIRWGTDRLGRPLDSNVNRMLTTTYRGLQHVCTGYACKTRTDVLFTGSGFLENFGSVLPRNKSYSFTTERIVLLNIFTRNARVGRRFCFCGSDLVLLGLTKDLQNLFDIPLDTPENVGCYFNESYLYVHFFQKFAKVDFRHFRLCDKNMCELYERCLSNNFMIKNIDSADLRLPMRLTAWDTLTTYSMQDWYRLARGSRWDSVWLSFKSLFYWLLSLFFELRASVRLRTRLRALWDVCCGRVIRALQRPGDY